MINVGLLFLIILLMPLSLRAGSQSSGYDFLRVDFNPRSRALAGAVFARQNDISTIRYNPAALAGTSASFLSLNYVNYLLDMTGGEVLYSHKLPSAGRISGVLTYFDYGSFEEVTFFDHSPGKIYTASEILFALAWSGKLHENLSYGAALKYLYSEIHEYNSSLVAIDLGMIWQTPFDPDLSLGISFLNTGRTVDPFIERRENLPTTLNMGITKKLNFLPLELNLAFQDLIEPVAENRSWADKIALGGELNISGMAFVRAGYATKLYHDNRIELGYSGLALGVGIEYDSYKFDYSYSSYGILGNSHVLGLVYHFGNGQQSARLDMSPALINLPPSPEKFTGGILANTINFFWQEMPGYRFNLYLKQSDQRTWSRLNDQPISGNSAEFMRPRMPGTYFFLIRAVSADGLEGPASDQIWLRLP